MRCSDHQKRRRWQRVGHGQVGGRPGERPGEPAGPAPEHRRRQAGRRRNFRQIGILVRVAHEHAPTRPRGAMMRHQPFRRQFARDVDASVAPAVAVTDQLAALTGHPALGREGGRHDDGAKPALAIRCGYFGGRLASQAAVDLLVSQFGADHVPGQPRDPGARDACTGIPRLAVERGVAASHPDIVPPHRHGAANRRKRCRAVEGTREIVR